jgi:hypothetical protein
VNPYSSQSSSSSYSGSQPAKNLSVHLVLATHLPFYDASFVELDAKGGVRKDLSLAMVSYASNQYINNISLSNFNPSHSHMLSHPNTYLITTSHLISLSHWHGRLPLAHVSTAKAGTHTEIPGKVVGLLSTSQVKLYLGKVYSRKIRHMYRSINQKLCRGLHIPQDSYPRRCLI